MIANRSKVEKYVADLAPEADMNFNTAIRTYGRTLNQGKLRDNRGKRYYKLHKGGTYY